MDGCIYRSSFDLCEKSKEEDEKQGIRRWCDFEGCEDKHPSNADRIRDMTDEELADLFDTWIRDCDCNDVPCRTFCQQGCFNCEKNWLRWLKQEAKHGCAN